MKQNKNSRKRAKYYKIEMTKCVECYIQNMQINHLRTTLKKSDPTDKISLRKKCGS